MRDKLICSSNFRHIKDNKEALMDASSYHKHPIVNLTGTVTINSSF